MRLNLGPYEKYLNSTFAPEDEVLLSVRESLKADELEGINVGAYEGKLLQFLIQVANVQKVAEVGTLYGYSTLWMARALGPDGRLITVDINEAHQEKAKELLKRDPSFSKIQFVTGDAKALLPSIESEGPFDMVFIDANKAGYVEYLDWAERNVRPGGLIVGDNTILFGHLLDDPEPINKNMSPATIEKMKVFNQRLADPKKYMSIMIPTAEGMTVAKKL